MSRILILGSGLVGSTMAVDLARDRRHELTVADRNEQALQHAHAKVRRLTGTEIDLSTLDVAVTDQVASAAHGYDLVLGALPSQLGFSVMRSLADGGCRYVDISFMSENALTLDESAKAAGSFVVFDCGVAPGLSNMLAAHEAAQLDRCDSIEIYVGGLPVERRWPFAYKAAFSPSDVVEEYTRPARLVERGEIITREALSEPELLYFPEIGDIEAFNTDGLRSMLHTLDVPNMKEKTLRYPGHIELMRVFRATGLFSHEPLDVGDVVVRPIDVTSALMFPQWEYGAGERDLTVMRIIVRGELAGDSATCTWNLRDTHNVADDCSSMSRTTAFPATIVARLMLEQTLSTTGVLAPEQLADIPGVVDSVVDEMRSRGVQLERDLDT